MNGWRSARGLATLQSGLLLCEVAKSVRYEPRVAARHAPLPVAQDDGAPSGSSTLRLSYLRALRASVVSFRAFSLLLPLPVASYSFSQFSIFRPATRRKCASFPVISTNPRPIAMEAMRRSGSSRGRPSL